MKPTEIHSDETVLLKTLGIGIRIRCKDSGLREILTRNFRAMQTKAIVEPDLDYTVERTSSGSITLHRDGLLPVRARMEGEFVYNLEHDVVIELQRRRRDLYFLHAAALEFNGKGLILVAQSGHGKSTTAWGLVHAGFRYMSDELAPIAPSSLKIHPYPHAICLKKIPPQSHPLPGNVVRTERAFHIPTTSIPTGVWKRPIPIQVACFVRYDPQARTPSVDSIGPGEAGARLYANALNPLAHRSSGLTEAARIARSCRSFRVSTADLRQSAELIQKLMTEEA